MADKEKFPLDPSDGGSSPPMTKEESAQKRKKAATAVLDGCAPKRWGEESNEIEEEPWRAVDSQLTYLEGEEGDDSDYEEYMVGLRARFNAKVQKLLADNPSVVVVDYTKLPCTSRPDGQNDATQEEEEEEEEEEEIGGAAMTPAVSG